MKLKLFIATAVAALVATMFGAPAGADDHARIHLLHGIPDTDVDVVVGGEAVLEGFAFGDTNDLSGFAGETLENVKVNVAGTDDTAIDAGDVELPAEGNFTAIAHLDADGTPTLSVFENDESTVEAGEGRLVVRHTAAAPAVDIKANGDVAFAEVENGDEGSADLPAGTVSAEVVAAGADEAVIGPADVPVAEGQATIVYAVGSLDDGSLAVLTETIDGLHSTPDEINTGTSPIESTTVLTTTGLVAAGAAAVISFGIGARRMRQVTAQA